MQNFNPLVLQSFLNNLNTQEIYNSKSPLEYFDERLAIGSPLDPYAMRAYNNDQDWIKKNHPIKARADELSEKAAEAITRPMVYVSDLIPHPIDEYRRYIFNNGNK